jgi:CRISPR/Cas system-associated exonuclease Cas4 (RecB family)
VRRLVQSASYAVLLDRAAEFLASLKGHAEVLVLAQSRGAADDFARASCGAGLVGVHRMTLTGLAVDLAEGPLARAGLTPVGALGAEAMVARVIHKLKAESIPYFQPVADTPGLARAVARTIAELRLEGVRPEQVAATGLPGRDLARMAALYEEELANRAAADFPLLLLYAIAAAREGKHRLLGIPVVLLDVDLDAALRSQLAEALLERSPEVFDGCLTSGAGSPAAAPSPAATTLDRIRESLFNPSLSPPAEPDTTLDYFSAAGESLECIEIARRIQKSAADAVPFDRIAILLRSPQRYQPLIEEALRRAGIPAYFSRGVARPDPAGRAFLALLACAGEGCSATRFAEYLSLGQAPPLDRAPANAAAPLPPDDELLARFYERNEPVAPELDPDPDPAENEDAAVIGGTLQSPAAWEKLLVDAAVIGGRDRWARRLRGLEAEFRVRLADLGQKEEGRRPHLEREIARLRNLERFALPLIDRLAALPRHAAWGDWIDHLTALAAAALRRPESVLSVLAELQAMADVGPVGLDEVSGVLSDRLRFLRREPPLRRYGHVFVSGIDEVRGRVFDIVFLPGLCEGLFPTRAHEDPILLDVYRAKVAQASACVPALLRVQDDRVADERRRLHIACAAARARLVFSYPRMDAVESRPRVPSFYALEIVRAAHGRLPELRQFEEHARRGAPSRLDWPAPLEPLEAIDDAEFDLAALGRTDAQGSGNYLIAANRYLADSLRRYARRNRTAWFPADGIVEPDAATRAVLATQRLAARSYSPSALQHFAACPYRFLLHAIHRLRPREEKVALEQMDPLTRGALFHQAQFRLFGELQSAQLLPMRPQNAARILEIADGVLDRVAADNEEKLAPAIPRVWRSEIEDLRIDLRGWIQQVAALDDGWIPAHFEFSFGIQPDELRDPHSTNAEAVLDNGVRLRGAIDLIEKHPLRGTLRITDHKTGKPPQELPKYVGGGTLLQPLAYALAAETLLGASAEVSRLSYCTERGGHQEIRFDITPRHRAFFTHAMSIIDGQIDRGFLPAAPQSGACGMCDYLPVCGPNEERRTARKRREPLEALQDLRNIP